MCSSDLVRVLFISPESGTVVREVTIPDARGYDLALEVSAEAVFLAWLDDDAALQLARIPRAAATVERTTLPFGAAAFPALSWNGSSLLVTWNTMREIIGSPMRLVPDAVRAARVSGTLTLLDATPVLLEAVEGAGAMDESAPSAASDGQEWIVTWGVASSIRAARISDAGVRGTVSEIAHGEAPLVVRNGDRYSLAWSESIPPTGDLRRLFVADVVVADGRLGSTLPAVASVTPFFGHVSSVAAGANRAVGVAWHSASAPEFDFQASFRILGSFTGRRRSVRVPG